METVNVKLLAWDIPIGNTQPVRDLLIPFLISHTDIKSFMKLSSTHNRLLLHPRIKQIKDLPSDILEACYALEATDSHQIVEKVPLTTFEQISTVLFFSNSKPAPALLPGLPKEWRRVLSNFYPTILKIDGRTYASIEHFFQGQKANCSTKPEMALWFSADFEGADKVEDAPAAAKKAGSRKAYTQQNATLDINLWESKRIDCMRKAIMCRFEQDELFRQVLASTKGMKLLHFERSGARSFWGGNFSRQTGEAVGENQLGILMTAIRDKGINEE